MQLRILFFLFFLILYVLHVCMYVVECEAVDELSCHRLWN